MKRSDTTTIQQQANNTCSNDKLFVYPKNLNRKKREACARAARTMADAGPSTSMARAPQQNSGKKESIVILMRRCKQLTTAITLLLSAWLFSFRFLKLENGNDDDWSALCALPHINFIGIVNFEIHKRNGGKCTPINRLDRVTFIWFDSFMPI